VIRRIIDAPLALVWKAWTEPEHVVRWWGPKDYTSPSAKIDLRVGGKYIFCMRAPQEQGGQDSYTAGIYQRIVPLQLLEFTQGLSDEQGNPIDPQAAGMPPDFPKEIRTVVAFKAKGGMTELTITEYGWTPGVMSVFSLAGMHQSIDKLAESYENQNEAGPAQKITPFLWFNYNAEEAVRLYTSVFKNSRITGTSYYGESGPGPKGSVMTIAFELEGQAFTALNGGPEFPFTEAVSLYVDCETQAEVDDLWEKLTEGGEESQCGWLKDKFGLSWQIVPKALIQMLGDPDPVKAQKVMQAMLQMRKIDIEKLRQARDI
jgi:predicted 3-demethylubiquinone-9 3-methyltransferase (glyoxalase superfamily)/uncharacterized protein YndB with AHSA1/START domain